MDVNDAELILAYPSLIRKKVGTDVAEILGITKYEPPLPKYQSVPRKGSVKNHPDFGKYTDIENYKYYVNLFCDTELVNITEKIHGTSARYGLYQANPNGRFSWLKRIGIKLGLVSQYEFVYGSRNIQLQTGGKVYYATDVYAEVAKKYDLENVLSTR